MSRAWDERAEHVGLRSYTRPWWVKLALLALFAVSVAAGAGLMMLFKACCVPGT
jgi:hypothetical protein